MKTIILDIVIPLFMIGMYVYMLFENSLLQKRAKNLLDDYLIISRKYADILNLIGEEQHNISLETLKKIETLL